MAREPGPRPSGEASGTGALPVSSPARRRTSPCAGLPLPPTPSWLQRPYSRGPSPSGRAGGTWTPLLPALRPVRNLKVGGKKQYPTAGDEGPAPCGVRTRVRAHAWRLSPLRCICTGSVPPRPSILPFARCPYRAPVNPLPRRSWHGQ